MISSFCNNLCRGLRMFLLRDLRPGGRRRWKADACLLTTTRSRRGNFSFLSIHHPGREGGREGDRVMLWFLQTDKGMRRHTLMHVKIFVPLLVVLSRMLKALLLTVQRETHVVSTTFFHSPVFLFVSVVSLV